MGNANPDRPRDDPPSGVLFAEERQRAIMEMLGLRGKVTVEELTQSFQVSPPTIRMDLSRLEESGLLRRTHGGAIAVSNTLYEPTYAERAVLRKAEKMSIARTAGGLVNERETVLLDAGTTCHEVALVLKEFRRLTVVTNSIVSAQVLAENDGIETILMGGVFQARRRATLGALSAQFLDPIRCDKAFIAMSGVHPSAGFTVVDFDAAQVKRRMLEKSKEAYVVADATKLGQIAFARVAPLSAAALLITDNSVSPEVQSALEETGLRILIAG